MKTRETFVRSAQKHSSFLISIWPYLSSWVSIQRSLNALKKPTHHIGGPINHARGGLKTVLHKNLWPRVRMLLKEGPTVCSCWDATVGQYIAALANVKAFPVEDFFSFSSVTEILQGLDNFDFTYMGGCTHCQGIDWNYIVRQAKNNTAAYFEGLCLDCMARSQGKKKKEDREYWKANRSVGGRWDTRCAMRHRQQTWYVSWLGRDDVRYLLLEDHKGRDALNLNE